MTVYRDQIFPIQPPQWLFCYDIVIHRASQSVIDTDDNGWPVYAADDVAAKAYVSDPDSRTLVPQGEAVDTVILVPNGTEVDHRDLVTVPDGQQLASQLVGKFRINVIRPNPSHTRLLCTRITDPAGAEA